MDTDLEKSQLSQSRPRTLDGITPLSSSATSVNNEKTKPKTPVLDQEYDADDADDDDGIADDAARFMADHERAAGLHERRIGVIWDGLSVLTERPKATHSLVQTVPNVFLRSFNAVTPAVNLITKVLSLVFPKSLSTPKAVHDARPEDCTILDSLSGLCRPGETVLVLGRPGSGCSTFLKTISNQFEHYSEHLIYNRDAIQFGPLSPAEFGKSYCGEALYHPEAEFLHPTLTVAQTIDTALKLKVAPNSAAMKAISKASGLSRIEYIHKARDNLLRSLNILHTADTCVGGDDQTRGVSGGERRRVGIIETLAARAPITAFDNPTKGLDSTSALRFARFVQSRAKLEGNVVFAALYQPSNSVYNCFDKVLLLDQGQVAFFGPSAKATAYLDDLGFSCRPGQSTAEFLIACTDEFEREYKVGFGPENAPCDSATFAAAWNGSAHKRQIDQEIAQYKAYISTSPNAQAEFKSFQIAINERCQKFPLPLPGFGGSSSYPAGLPYQILVLLQREVQRTVQDLSKIIITGIRSIIFGVFFGLLFINLGSNSASALSRTGLIWMVTCIITFITLSEGIAAVGGRSIMVKHRISGYYKMSGLWIAQLFGDVVFLLPNIVSMVIILYFMSGFVRTADAFFITLLVLFLASCSNTFMVRTVGSFSRTVNQTILWLNVITAMQMMSGGWMTNYRDMRPWIQWFYWLNPIALGVSALADNEFSRIDFSCSGAQLIPSGPGYEDVTIDNQVCTLAGSEPGRTEVSGSAYLLAAYAIERGVLWKRVANLVALTVGYLILNIVAGEVFRFSQGTRTPRVFIKPTDENTKLNEQLEQHKLNRRTDLHNMAIRNQDLSLPPGFGLERFQSNKNGSGNREKMSSGNLLTWQDLGYSVPALASGKNKLAARFHKKEDKRLLTGVSGYVKPGHLTALMGASGAGKTTLLDVLAARKTMGRTTGTILLDGAALGKQFSRRAAYAEQIDCHDYAQTVREILRFAADMRQDHKSPSFPAVEKARHEHVEAVISLLELEDVADCLVGGNPSEAYLGSGLGVSHLKRLTIGVELAAQPDMIIFLDEPTSGLDSSGALAIARCLRRLADAGSTILCTIHQPSTEVFEVFDRVLLLEEGGRTAYFGDLGPQGTTVRSYFETRSTGSSKPDLSVAEYIIDAVSTPVSNQTESSSSRKKWADIWEDSSEAAVVQHEMQQLCDEHAARSGGSEASIDNNWTQREYARSQWHQIVQVSRRMTISLYRSPSYGVTKFWQHVIGALINGLGFYNLNESRQHLTYHAYVIWQVFLLTTLIIMHTATFFNRYRSIFWREHSVRTYSPWAFGIGFIIAETPYTLVSVSAFFLPMYFLPFAAVASDSARAGFAYLCMLTTSGVASSMALLLTAMSPNMTMVGALAPLAQVLFLIFNGVTIWPDQIPAYLRYSLYHIFPFSHMVASTVSAVLHQLPVRCLEDEFARFVPPEGGSGGNDTAGACEAYMAPFFANGNTGLVEADPQEPGVCRYCQYKIGDEFYEQIGYRYEDRWWQMGIYACYIGVFFFLTLLCLRFCKFHNR